LIPRGRSGRSYRSGAQGFDKLGPNGGGKARCAIIAQFIY
jgi:hypothetical protein